MTEDEKLNKVKADIAAVCSGVINSPETILGSLTADMYKFQDFARKLNSAAKTLKDNNSVENTTKQLINTMVVARELCESHARVLALLHIYLLGSNVSADAGKAAMTLGVDGEDVLRAMLNAKFGR